MSTLEKNPTTRDRFGQVSRPGAVTEPARPNGPTEPQGSRLPDHILQQHYRRIAKFGR